MLPWPLALLLSLVGHVLAAPNSVVSEVDGSDTQSGTQTQYSGAQTQPWQWGNGTIRGVNLGGWLVFESFIVPNIVSWNLSDYDPHVTDEWTLSRKFGQEGATKMLRPHWDTFITQDDFKQIRAAGLNTIRIPIGYWSVLPKERSDGFAYGAMEYLVKAVDVWAREAGLFVIIDLHGARGSQNGFDNSGQLGESRFFNSTEDINATLDAVKILAEEFGQAKYDNVVSAFAVLNEPATFFSQPAVEVNWEFNRRAYDIVRAVNSETVVLFQEAFQPLPTWQNVYLEPEYHNVAFDHHTYSIFADNTVLYAKNLTELDNLVCDRAANVSVLNSNTWTVVGEFTAAVTDCAPLVNSAQQNVSRWEQAGNSCDGWTGYLGLTADNIATMRHYTEQQFRQWEKAGQGWVFWTWKTLISPEWSLKTGMEIGIIPVPFDNYSFPDPCPSLANRTIVNPGAVYTLPHFPTVLSNTSQAGQ